METTQLLSKLVSLSSVYPDEANLADFLACHLTGLGFTVTRQAVGPGRLNVLAEKGTGQASLLLFGHMDTVPVAEGWSRPPFEPYIDADRLYGLGAYDMKAGICAILQAADQFEPMGYRLKVAFLVDEENDSAGAYALIRSPWMQDIVAALVPESNTGTNVCGPRVIGLGRRGRLTVDVTVRGRSAHAARAEQGVSALLRGATIALALKELPLAYHGLLGPASATIRRFHSEGRGLSIPDLAQLVIDRHIVPPESQDVVLHDLEKLIQGLIEAGALECGEDMPITVSVPQRANPYLMPYVTPADHPFVHLVENAVYDLLGPTVHGYGGSVADENYFGATLGLPVIGLGALGASNHAPNEWVSLSSVEELVMVYREILRRFPQALADGAL